MGALEMNAENEIQIREFAAADYECAVELWSNVEGIALNESDTKEAIVAFLDRSPGFSAIATNGAGKVVGAVLCGHNGRLVFFTTWRSRRNFDAGDLAVG